jgi:hypothetical protein
VDLYNTVNMNKISLPLIIFLLVVGGCKKNECVRRAVDQMELAGDWHQEDAEDPHWYERVVFDITFTADSFRMKMTEWSDVVGGGPCPNSRHYEYVKGSFVLQDQAIILSGLYTEADYTPKTSGCYTIGGYSKKFRIYKECELLALDGIIEYEVVKMLKLR